MTDDQPQLDEQQPQRVAPDDIDDDAATGHAVYDETLMRYVGPVHRSGKPSAKAVRELVGDHPHTVVRV